MLSSLAFLGDECFWPNLGENPKGEENRGYVIEAT